MKFSEIINRVTGFSVPLFGIQWSPPEIEVSKARRLVTFLEDRRVLYAPENLENIDYSLRSVLRIREYLTDEIGHVDSNNELSKNLRAMRAACRKLLYETSEQEGGRILFVRHSLSSFPSEKFYSKLGIMRGVFGVHIALIASAYGLDVEADLASILPDVDAHDDSGVTKLDLD
jgi:hypothetical protein